jgi:hypothetical protein
VPSSVTANLLDDGVDDALGLVGAISGVHSHVSVNVFFGQRANSLAQRMAIPFVAKLSTNARE